MNEQNRPTFIAKSFRSFAEKEQKKLLQKDKEQMIKLKFVAEFCWRN